MGIAHGRADILVAEQFLDFPQILSHLVEEDRGRGVAQPMRGDLPYPEGSTGGPQPQIERPVGKRRARISCKHKLAINAQPLEKVKLATLPDSYSSAAA